MESVIEEIYRSQSRRVLATLIRLLGDFDRAEEALHDAFAAAARTWPADGIPGNPFAWLVSTGRFKAIDTIRRRARFDASQQHIEDSLYTVDETEIGDLEAIEDDMLRLVFTCCHPVIPADAQMALALREICGLT
ncbi:sigma factor, partial [Rhizobium phaseoli]